MVESLPVILAALVHELTQPLSIAQLAVDRKPPDFALLHHALRRASRRCQVFRWLAQVYRGDPAAEQALAPQTVSMALTVTTQRVTGLNFDMPLSMCVYTAPAALETVLENLTSNANKHAPLAKVTVQARVLEETDRPWPADAPVKLQGRKLLLTVADNGPGIPPEIRPLLFQPIVRTTPEHERVSVGLWLCRVIVRAHGGDLWLDDNQRGASFSSVWRYAPLRDRTSPIGAQA